MKKEKDKCMVKISIIIPIYNGEKFIEQCLKSVLLQDVKEKEIICVDDGSTDETVTIIKRLQKEHSEIKLIRQANMGAAIARNVALKEAKGQYVSFMDADDTYIDASGLKKMIEACEKYNISICGSLRCMKRDDEITKADTYRAEFDSVKADAIIVNYKDVQYDYYYQSYVFEKDFLVKHQLEFPNLRRYQDPPFFVRAMWYAEQLVVLPIELYCYRVRTESFHFNFIQMNDTLKGLKMNIQFACEKKLEIVFENSANRINKDFYYRIKNSLIEGNLEAIRILLEIQEIVKKNPFGKDVEIKVLKDIEETLKKPVLNSGEHRFPYEKIPYRSNVAIYGAGVVGKYIYQVITQTGYCNLVVWVDRNYEKLQKIGFPVKEPKELEGCCAEYIIIAIESDKVYTEIKEDLISKGWSCGKNLIGPIEKIN